MPRFTPYGFIRQLQTLFTVKDGTVVVETYSNPLADVANRYVVSVAMGNKTYTLANSGLPGDGLAHLVTLKRTAVSTGDTPGIVTFTGLDNDGVAITDVLTVSGVDTTEVVGVKAFKSISTIVGSGWTIAATADNIVMGFKNIIGLNKAIAAGADILTVYDAASLAATASFTGTGDGTLSGSYFTPTGANGALDYTAVYRPSQSAVLVGTGAITIATTAALGYQSEVEAFGLHVVDALGGAGGTHSYVLKNGSNVIATLTVALASGAAGATIETTTIVKAYRELGNAATLTLARLTGGTTFTAGSGSFYVRLRQRAQRAD